MASPTTPRAVQVVGRYAIHAEIASGGMAAVHFGKLAGPVGFSRPVAIKKLHAQFARDPEFVTMFLDEARLAARIQHPNVVPTLDIVNEDGELFLVMEYVQGEALSRLVRAAAERGTPIPLRVVATIMSGALHGLHAAHEAKDEKGMALEIVHRDVSPQNVLVGADGVPRVLDFGVAKAAGRLQTTREGQLKGKLAYMAPEQLRGGLVSRATDVYAVGVVMWETLGLRRLFEADNEGHLLAKVLEGHVVAPSSLRADVPSELDAIVLRAISSDATQRFGTAREMALAIERAVGLATASEVGEWVMTLAGATLARRAERLADLDGAAQKSGAPTERPPAQRRGASNAAVSEETLASASGRGSVPAPPERASSTVAPPRPSLSPPLEKTPASSTLGAFASSIGGTQNAYVPSAPSSAVTPPSSSASAVTSSASASSASAATAGSASATTAPKRTRRHILVIDDSEVMLSRIRRALELEGYDVTATARAVGNARHIASSDLIIIDYHMPGIDGGTVIQSLRAAATTKGHPCLFYLYTSDAAVARDFQKLGFDGSFTDKGNEESLTRQVRAVFRMLQMRQLSRKA